MVDAVTGQQQEGIDGSDDEDEDGEGSLGIRDERMEVQSLGRNEAEGEDDGEFVVTGEDVFGSKAQAKLCIADENNLERFI